MSEEKRQAQPYTHANTRVPDQGAKGIGAEPDMSHSNNSSPPWRRILLTAAMLGTIVLAVGAATALLLQNEANRASLTKLDQKLDALTQKADRLQQDLNSLATDTPAPTPSNIASQPTMQPAATPTRTRPALTRTPTGTPRPMATAVATPVPSPMPAGPGICGRSPTVQNMLLSVLKISSCQAITEPELFRITGRMSIDFETPPQPGDFTGLVNLQELSIQVMQGETLPAGTFHGLDNLRTLTVSMQGNEDSHSTIGPGAFAGMSSLETLQINWPINSSNQRRRPTLPPLDHIPTLEILTITTRGWIFTPQASHLRDQPNLKTLVIRGEDYSETSPRWFRLEANLFENNPALEVVEIRLDTSNTQVAIAKDALSQLHGLQEISLSPYSDSEIFLSPNSPLMKDILNGRKSPNGYTLIPPGATSP